MTAPEQLAHPSGRAGRDSSTGTGRTWTAPRLLRTGGVGGAVLRGGHDLERQAEPAARRRGVRADLWESRWTSAAVRAAT
jgi:hypothetical protein